MTRSRRRRARHSDGRRGIRRLGRRRDAAAGEPARRPSSSSRRSRSSAARTSRPRLGGDQHTAVAQPAAQAVDRRFAQLAPAAVDHHHVGVVGEVEARQAVAVDERQRHRGSGGPAGATPRRPPTARPRRRRPAAAAAAVSGRSDGLPRSMPLPVRPLPRAKTSTPSSSATAVDQVRQLVAGQGLQAARQDDRCRTRSAGVPASVAASNGRVATRATAPAASSR